MITAFTIAAANYLAHARVLARSFQEHHGRRLKVFVLDELNAEPDPDEPFDRIPLEILGLTRSEYHARCAGYELLELATSVKPRLIGGLAAQCGETIVYLDPDIEIFSPLRELEELTREHHIVLTPHLLRPLPRDELMIGELQILRAGTFNLGFLAVAPGPTCCELVSWWEERLRFDCINQPQEGFFVDQRWMDLVPSYFRHHVLRDPGYNLAYWNIAHRRIARNGSGWTVDGNPLRFLHFSGFDPQHLHLLSRHQGAEPRVLLSEQPLLAHLCRRYATALHEEGWDRCRARAYRFDRMGNGVPLDRRMRRLYREASRSSGTGNGASRPLPDVFDVAGATDLLDWLRSPATSEKAVSRYLESIWRESVNLQVHMPDLHGSDAQRFVDWVRTRPAVSPPIPEELLPPPRARDGDRFAGLERSEHSGVNVIGYVRAESGMGEVPRLMASVLERLGVPYRVIRYHETWSRQQEPYEPPAEQAVFDTNLICVNADALPGFVRWAGPSLFADRYNVGLWAWEIDSMPGSMAESAAHLDEIWAISEFAAGAIRGAVDKPVHAMPLPIAAHEPGDLARGDLDLGEEFLVLFSFDFDSVVERKNPFATVEAFRRAFPDRAGPRLLVKSINGDRHVAALERLRLAAADRPDVTIWDGYLEGSRQRALIGLCDVYLSLHRSEGFGLTIAEAMAQGRPVVATGYGGHLDYLDGDCALLVPFDLVAVGPGNDPYPAGGRWAEPWIDDAADALRRLHDDPELRAKLGERARERARRYAPAARCEQLLERLCVARQRWAEKHLSPRQRPGPVATGIESAPEAATPLTPSVEVAVVDGSGSADETTALAAPASALPFEPALNAPSPYGATARLARRIVFRLARNYHLFVLGLRDHLARAIEAQARMARSLDRAFQEIRRSSEAAIGAGELARHASATATSAIERCDADELVRTRHGEMLRRLDRAVAALEWAERRHEIHLGALQRSFDAAALETRLRELSERIDSLDQRIEAMAEEMTARPYLSPTATLALGDPSSNGGGWHCRSAGVSSRRPWVDFLDLFRGSQPMIRERQRVYVDLVDASGPVLDLGCGRGEFLDLMKEAGRTAIGVDSDPHMVELCLKKGHEVLEADGLRFLEEQPENSLGTVFCAQVVEHLQPEELLRFFELCGSRLRPGGRMIAETVNPHSFRAFKAFWVDPTHRAPIFPEVALALCRIHGFEEISVFFPSGCGALETDRTRCGEFAVIASKAAALPP